jgi:hypothetical protein
MKFSRSAIRRSIGLAGLIGAGALLTACGGTTSSADPAATVTITATAPASTAPASTAPASTAPASTAPASTDPPASPTAPAGAGSTSSAPGLPTCLASALRARLGSSDGTAGTINRTLRLTSTSSGSCVLYGFPGVSFVTSPGGRQIGAAATRSHLLAPVSVVLRPGEAAQLTVGVAEAGNFPVATCRPIRASWLRVFPPGDYGAVYVRDRTQTCASSAVSVLTVTAVRPAA